MLPCKTQIAFIINHVGLLRNAKVCACRVMRGCSNTSTMKLPRRHVWKETLVLITSSPSVLNIPLRVFKVLSVPPAATCTFHCLVWCADETQKAKFFGSRWNPADEKWEICYLERFPFPLLPADNSRCDISPQWDWDPICLWSAAYELLHHFGSWDGTGVGEKVRGKKKRLLGIKS